MPGEWYAALKKPSWNPPGWIFGPVWSALCTMIAVAVDGVKDDTSLFVSTIGEENSAFRIQGKAGWPPALLAEIVVRSHRERFGVNYGNIVFVFDINIHMAFAVALSLLRCAAEVNCSDDCSFL